MKQVWVTPHKVSDQHGIRPLRLLSTELCKGGQTLNGAGPCRSSLGGMTLPLSPYWTGSGAVLATLPGHAHNRRLDMGCLGAWLPACPPVACCCCCCCCCMLLLLLLLHAAAAKWDGMHVDRLIAEFDRKPSSPRSVLCCQLGSLTSECALLPCRHVMCAGCARGRLLTALDPQPLPLPP